MKGASVPCIWPMIPWKMKAKPRKAFMKVVSHESVLVHRQPIRVEKQQKRLEEVKRNKQKIQDLEKKIRKTRKGPLKCTSAFLNRKATNFCSGYRMLKELLPQRRWELPT